jgi:phage FluMu protein Com
MIICPACNKILMEANKEGNMRLKSRLVLFEDGGAKAICPQCKAKVSVPLKLDTSNTRSSTNNNIKHIIMTK